jgi:hypothetical protein
VLAAAALAAPAAYAAAEPGLALLGAVGVGVLLAGTAVRVAEAIPVGLTLVGVEYSLFLVLDDRAIDQAAPLVAGGLLLAAELAHSALDPPLAATSTGLRALRLLRLTGVVVAGAAVAALVLYVAEADARAFPALEALGVLAAVAAAGLLALLARKAA